MEKEIHISKESFISWKGMDAPDYHGLKLDKVIFLDIDGVLNDEGTNYRKGVKVERGMVQCLKKIIDKTDAEVILTSSWRFDYLRFVEANYKTEDKEISTLDRLFTEFDISVRGMVPITSWSGPSSRPAEIFVWLDVIPVNSYVILDDDDFWMWEKYKFEKHLVLTKRNKGRSLVRGLTDGDAGKAIEILNATSLGSNIRVD